MKLTVDSGCLVVRLTLAVLFSMCVVRGSAFADTLQASADTTSVSVALTLGSGTFPVSFTNSYTGRSTISGDINGSQVYNMSTGGSLFSLHSIGPVQISDPPTASLAQSAASVIGSLDDARQTLSVFMSSAVFAMGAFEANANGGTGTVGLPPGLTLPAFSQPTAATLNIDLIADYGANPAPEYGVQTSASGAGIPTNHFAQAVSTTFIDSNLPGAFTIFGVSATESWYNGVTTLTVDSFSPFIAQPIFASDFIADPSGSYSLDPNKRHISIPFTIPATPFQLQFAVRNDTSAQIVPEPSAIALAAAGLVALAALCRSRARR